MKEIFIIADITKLKEKNSLKITVQIKCVYMCKCIYNGIYIVYF